MMTAGAATAVAAERKGRNHDKNKKIKQKKESSCSGPDRSRKSEEELTLLAFFPCMR